jgi:hypothetical protein
MRGGGNEKRKVFLRTGLSSSSIKKVQNEANKLLIFNKPANAAPSSTHIDKESKLGINFLYRIDITVFVFIRRHQTQEWPGD